MGEGKTVTEKARLLRKTATRAESILWRALRYQKLGVKFRRQEPIDYYISDFCCIEKRLIIELDGGIHNEDYQKKYDRDRTDYLKDQGFHILRFKNKDIEENLELVIDKIKAAVTSPLPPTGEGICNSGNRGG